MIDHQIPLCRSYYSQMRLTNGGPVIIAFKTNWSWYIETKEGEKLFESKQAHCSWCAKSEGLHRWRELHPKETK